MPLEITCVVVLLRVYRYNFFFFSIASLKENVYHFEIRKF